MVRTFIKGDKKLLLFGILAGFLLIYYCFYLFYLPLTPGRLARPSAGLIDDFVLWRWLASPVLKPSAVSGVVAVVLLFLGGLGSLAYAAAVYLATRNRKESPRELRLVIVVSVLFFILSTVSFPTLNTDIYHYITRARVAAVYGANPHYVSADTFPDDPIYPYASHRWTRLTGEKFGAWTWLSIGLAKIAGDDPVANLFTFRLAFLLFNFGNLFLVVALLRKLDPRYLLPGVVFFGWNPVVAMLGSSKTDTVMAFFVLAAVLLLVHARKGLSVASMVFSILIKAMTFPYLGLYFLQQIKLRNWRDLTVGMLLVCVVTTAVYWPFWEGPSLISSHLSVVREVSTSTMPRAAFWFIVPGFLLAAVALAYLQDGSHRRLLLSWALVGFGISILLVPLHSAWYHMFFLAVAAIAMNRGILVLATAVSIAAFAFNAWYMTFSRHFRVREISSLPPYLVFLAIVMVGALLLTAFLFLRNRREMIDNKGYRII